MSTRRSILNALYLMSQYILLNLISIPATAYVIRLLGPVNYGLWAVAASLVGVTTFITNLGLRTLFVRSIAQEPELASGALAEQLGLRSLLALAAGSTALLVCWLLGYPSVVLACVAVSALGLILIVLGSAFTDLLQGIERFQPLGTVSLIAGLVLTLATVLAVRWGWGPIGLSVAYLTGPLTQLGLLWVIVRRQHFPPQIRWDFRRYRILLGQSRLLGAQQFLATLQDRIEQLLVPKLIGIADFGYFSAGSLPSDRLTMVPDTLAGTFYPAIARNVKKDRPALRGQVLSLLAMSFGICLALALLVMSLATPIANILFPKSPTVCRDVMRITIWSLPLLGIGLPLKFVLQAQGKHAEAARAGMWASVWSVGISFLLINRWGLGGASWSWIFRNALQLGFLLPLFISSGDNRRDADLGGPDSMDEVEGEDAQKTKPQDSACVGSTTS